MKQKTKQNKKIYKSRGWFFERTNKSDKIDKGIMSLTEDKWKKRMKKYVRLKITKKTKI